MSGYQPCHNAEEVVAAAGYQPEADLANTPDSVFCAHGAGFVVNWRQVGEYMHLPPWQPPQPEPEEEAAPMEERGRRFRAAQVMDRELEAIFAQTYGPVKQRRAFESQARIRTEESRSKPVKLKEQPLQTEYLLVDGYNIIFAWDELKALAREDLSAARDRLLDILCNYRGMRRCEVIVVFDAYKVKGGRRLGGAVPEYPCGLHEGSGDGGYVHRKGHPRPRQTSSGAGGHVGRPGAGHHPEPRLPPHLRPYPVGRGAGGGAGDRPGAGRLTNHDVFRGTQGIFPLERAGGTG